MTDTEKESSASEFTRAGRLTYLRVNLDTIARNISILKGKCSQNTEVIAVVKANAYGHGSVAVSRFLERRGVVRNFAVATSGEGRELRDGGVHGNIHVLGNVSPVEIPACFKYNLIPTVASTDVLSEWAMHMRKNGNQETHTNNAVVIKVDTGMSRNGCQPEDFPSLIDFCKNNSILVHSIMTHFAQSWDDLEFTKRQMDIFMEAVGPYRSEGIKLHVSNSGAIVNGVGTELDFVRPGISMYGQSPDTSEFGISATEKLGLRPAVRWMAKPSLVKDLQCGRVVGYDKSYTCTGPETIASIPLGYADGYLRKMFNSGVVTTNDGTECAVVGRVSMDGITVRLPGSAKHCMELCVMSDDYHSPNSSVAMARVMNTIPYEVCTNLSPRVPRLYVEDGVIQPLESLARCGNCR